MANNETIPHWNKKPILSSLFKKNPSGQRQAVNKSDFQKWEVELYWQWIWGRTRAVRASSLFAEEDKKHSQAAYASFCFQYSISSPGTVPASMF